MKEAKKAVKMNQKSVQFYLSSLFGNKPFWWFSCILVMLTITVSCSQKEHEYPFSFYHWKSKATMNPTYRTALETAGTESIYLHYFDIEVMDPKAVGLAGIFPNNVVKEIDPAYRKYKIIPTIYITNQVLKTPQVDVAELSKKITALIHQISTKHFEQQHPKIQVDCDWTLSTKNVYFQLLENLKKEFTVDVTIRLHQIKFKEKTGIPPVDEGTLMLYNVGDLSNKYQNSILLADIVRKYVGPETQYPLELKLGLPLFDQTIAYNKEGDLKIIKGTQDSILKSDAHFSTVNKNLYLVEQDTLYKGIYLSKGYYLKTEHSLMEEILASYQIIKDSKLKINEIIFYHLDESSLSNINFITLIEAL